MEEETDQDRQIKVNESGFKQAEETLKGYIQEWELQNQELFRRLNELGENWKGISGRNYMQGSDCIYAHSVQKQRNLTQLRSDSLQARLAIELLDMKHALSLGTNIMGGK